MLEANGWRSDRQRESVATGESLEEVEQQIRQAIRLQIESLRAHGEPVPQPSTTAVGLVDDVA